MSDLARRLVGSWELVSYVLTDPESGGAVDHPLGEDARGLIIYTDDGHMSVQIGASRRPPYTDGDIHGGTTEERARAAHGYLAYAGTYAVIDDSIVEHHVTYSLAPNWEATTVARRATIDLEQRLHLELVELLVVAGKERGGVLIWKRC
jgi:hypothetical protein